MASQRLFKFRASWLYRRALEGLEGSNFVHAGVEGCFTEKSELEVSLETSEGKARKKVWHQPGIDGGRSQPLVSRDKRMNMEVAR